MNVAHYLKYVCDHNFCLTWVLVSDDWSQWSLSEGCFTQAKQGFKLIHGEISPGCFFDCKASCIAMLHTHLLGLNTQFSSHNHNVLGLHPKLNYFGILEQWYKEIYLQVYWQTSTCSLKRPIWQTCGIIRCQSFKHFVSLQCSWVCLSFVFPFFLVGFLHEPLFSHGLCIICV